MASIFNNVWDFIKDTSQKAGEWFSDKLTLSPETTDLLQGKNLSDFYKPGPDAASLIKSLTLEPFARTMQAGFEDIPGTASKEIGTLTPTSQAEKFLFGEEPIKPLSQQYREAKQSLESAGFKGISTPIAATAVFGGALLDVTMFGGSRKKLTEQLAKETSIDVISNILRKANVADDLILPYAEKFAKITKPAEIEKGLKALEDMVSTTGKVGSALHYTQSVLKQGEDIIAQTQKLNKTKVIGDMMTKWYDKYYNLGKFMDDVEKKIGRKLTAEENAYIGARNFSGASGKIENKLEKLGLVLRENSKNVETGILDNYLFNQRAIERSNRGFLNPGRVTTDLAKKALKELETEVGLQGFKKLQEQAAGVYKFGNDLLKYIYEGGVISKADYEMALKNNEMYVPFDVVEHLISKSDDFVPVGSKAFSVASQDLVKQTVGTELAVDSPINALFRKTIKAVDLVERNKVAQTLVDVRKIGEGLEESIIPMREAWKVQKRTEIYNIIKELNTKIRPLFTNLKNTFKADRTVLSKINSLEKEIGNLSGKQLEELYAFLNEGDIMKTTIPAYRRIGIIPEALQEIAQDVKKFKNVDNLMTSNIGIKIEKLYHDGILERNGFKSINDFFNYIKNPYKNVPSYEKEIEAIGDLPKIVNLQKQVEASVLKLTHLSEIDKRSINDSFRYLEETINSIQTKKDILREELKRITDITTVPAGFDKINVLRDGIKEIYAVPKDVADAMKRMNKEQIDFLTGIASWGSRALRAGATSYNPLFIVPNAWRDFQTATLVSKVGFNALDWRKGLWESFKAIANKYGAKLNDSLYKQYLEDAGQVGGYYTTYLNEIPKTAKDLTKSTGRKILSLLNPFKAIFEAGKIIEMAPRLGVYQKAMSRGLTGKAAGFVSREATVDFAKMGESMKIFNQWTPFINARLQGTVNIGKSLVGATKSPKRAAELSLKIGALAITPFVSSYYWNTSQFPEVWDDISDGDKSNYIILIYGNGTDENGNYNQVFKIPKGSFAYFIDPVQDLLEWQRGNVPNLYSRVAQDTLFNILPLSSTASGVSFPERAGLSVLGITPPAAKGVFEGLVGINFYTGKAIVPPSMEKVSPELQFKQNTPQVAKMIGEWLNISPLKLENAIRTMTGGVGTELLGTAGTVGKPGFTIPFVQGFKKKFTKAIGGEKEQKEIEKVQKYETQMADRKKVAKDTAQMIWNQIKNSDNPEEVRQLIADIGDDEDIKSQLVNMIGREITPYSIELLKTISPKERARYVYDELKSFKSATEAQPFLQKIQTGGIITNDVRKELKMLILQGQ